MFWLTKLLENLHSKIDGKTPLSGSICKYKYNCNNWVNIVIIPKYRSQADPSFDSYVLA